MATEAKGAAAAPAVPMVTCTIDGVPISVRAGTRIIEAAELAGIGIAHYCYHPALSAPAMCRMCLVEVEGAPKLAPACVGTVMDGQVILTESDRAREARQGTLEFYLINHPLDCPVCDASGECKLQDFVHAEGRKHGRSLEPKRVLGQDDFGGDVIYDGDRCIMCTRCVRFMREIAQDDRLCVVQRGHKSVIDTFFDHGVEGNLWAGNIIDICPVGALLSKDFLHKARAWDLDGAPSICPNCSQGCNIRIDTRDNLVMRVKPRANPAVNSYWMCDYGRYRYEWFNRSSEPLKGGIGMIGLAGEHVHPPRLEAPMLRLQDGRFQPGSWQDAIVALVARLDGVRGTATVRVIASPMSCNEDAGLLVRLGTVLGTSNAAYRSVLADNEEVCPGFPALARRRELAANGRGLNALGYTRVGDEAGAGGLEPVSGEILIVLGDELRDQPASFGSDAALFIYLGDAMTPAARNAHFALPVTNFAEQEGTFTNFDGRVQRFWPAVQAPPLARPAWQILGVVLAGLDDAPAPASVAAAFHRIGDLYEEFSGLSHDMIGARGALLNDRVRLTAGQA
jgi:NADH-quinone oxidoreductase subunit G